ncbi:MAG: hypothetical protein JXX14_16410 [Deltaproteobacteria bacterium]|nr:hypothetical protein [Deltaproteobacteria bacterium]
MTAPNDTNFEVCELLAIRWSTDHASGESLDAEIENQMAKFRVPSAADFENGDIIEVGTKKLNIELYCNAVLVLAEEYELFWNDYVCNKCTDRPWCDDGITSTASISIEINPTEFPVDQN